MRTRNSTLAATLVLSLLAVACNRSEQSPTAAAPSQERQATAPDRMMENAPPAAGSTTTSPESSGMPSSPGAAPSTTTEPSSSSPLSTPPAGDTSTGSSQRGGSSGGY